jgi:hypothetical protein
MRLGSPYRSGRVDHWLKVKNPAGAGRAPRDGRRLGPEAVGPRAAYLK